MKIIKRRREGEYHTTHFIMWQVQEGIFRLFVNIFWRQFNLNIIDGRISARFRKVSPARRSNI